MKQFYDAVQAMLPATVNSFLFEADLSNPPKIKDYPYVVFWGDAGTEHSGDDEVSSSLCDDPDAVTLRIRATYAGSSAGSLFHVISSTRAALNRKTPIVPGWSVSRLRQASLTDAQTDFALTLPSGHHPVFAVDEYTLTANRF